MQSMTNFDQPSPEEASLDELAGQLDEFREKTGAMADELSLATPHLREEGSPLPSNWARQYVKWGERRTQLATQIANQLGVESVVDQTFSDWSKSINQRRDALRTSREKEATEIRSVDQLLRRVQGVQSSDAQSSHTAEIEQARTLATILLERLHDPQTRSVVMQDAGTRKGLESMVLLIDGTDDNDREEQAVSDVETMFGKKLAIALLRGRITAPAVE